jgi:aspartate kinase
VLQALEKVFVHEIEDEDIDRVWSTEDVSIVTVVGAGMRHTPGIAGRIFSVLGADRINVIAIAQGSSECSISLVIDAKDGDEAVRSIHKLIA